MILPESRTQEWIKKVAAENGFMGAELVERTTRHNVPKSHAKFFFQVAYVSSGSMDKILLDVLFEESQYEHIERIPIKSPFLKTAGEDVFVEVPSKADLLGDKLAAFAPNTTGIPFVKNGVNRSMEVSKQMFDVASLFDVVNDLDTVLKVFKRIVDVEKSYRGMNEITYKDVLMDTIRTCESFATHGTNDPDTYKNLCNGISRVGGFIHTRKYNGETAGTDFSKVAYLASCLYAAVSQPERFDENNIQDLVSKTIIPVFNTKLNRLKRNDIEAFYYWQKASELLAK